MVRRYRLPGPERPRDYGISVGRARASPSKCVTLRQFSSQPCHSPRMAALLCPTFLNMAGKFLVCWPPSGDIRLQPEPGRAAYRNRRASLSPVDPPVCRNRQY
eukprot:scaffold29647_cov145-Isochrysis_galbana.AAC.1